MIKKPKQYKLLIVEREKNKKKALFLLDFQFIIFDFFLRLQPESTIFQPTKHAAKSSLYKQYILYIYIYIYKRKSSFIFSSVVLSVKRFIVEHLALELAFLLSF